MKCLGKKMKWGADMTLGHQTQSIPVLIALGDFSIGNKEMKPYSADPENENPQRELEDFVCLFVWLIVCLFLKLEIIALLSEEENNPVS